MFGRQVAVPSGHRDGFVSSQLLNLFDGRARHREQRPESVTIGVPDVARNLRLLETGLEPGSHCDSALNLWNVAWAPDIRLWQRDRGARGR